MFRPFGIREKRFEDPVGDKGEERLKQGEKTCKGSERENKLTPARESGISGLRPERKHCRR